MNTKNVLIVSLAFTICWIVMCVGMVMVGNDKREKTEDCIKLGNDELTCMCSHWACNDTLLNKLK